MKNSKINLGLLGIQELSVKEQTDTVGGKLVPFIFYGIMPIVIYIEVPDNA